MTTPTTNVQSRKATKLNDAAIGEAQQVLSSDKFDTEQRLQEYDAILDRHNIARSFTENLASAAGDAEVVSYLEDRKAASDAIDEFGGN